MDEVDADPQLVAHTPDGLDGELRPFGLHGFELFAQSGHQLFERVLADGVVRTVVAKKVAQYARVQCVVFCLHQGDQEGFFPARDL